MSVANGKLVSNAFYGNDFYGLVFLQVIAQLRNVNIEVA